MTNGIASSKPPSDSASPETRPGLPAGEGVRAFVAVPLPGELLDELARVQRRLRQAPAGRSVRWSRPDQVHLTLRFLGNVVWEDLDRLRGALNAACAGQAAFYLGLAGLGCFPHARNPRVLWIGLSGALDRLEELQRRVQTHLDGFGDHAEEARPFHPHLTLGRVNARGEAGQRIGDLLTEQPRHPATGWTVDQLDLVRSDLRPQGAQYRVLHSVRLGP